MKKITALIALIAVLAVSGCNSENKNETSGSDSQPTDASASQSEGTTADSLETEVIFSVPETEKVSEDALDQLGEHMPLYRKFLDKRMSVPLILECSISASTGESIVRNTYIRSDGCVSSYSKNIDGSENISIYSYDGCYYLDFTTKTAFQLKVTEDVLKDSLSQFKYSISDKDLETVTSYTSGEAEYNGVMYNYETMVDNGEECTFYFDKNTDEMVYTVTPEIVTKIDRIETAEPDSSLFTVPADYTVVDSSEYVSTSAEE